MDKILIIGDAIIDTNIVGECYRLSPEGPWVILKAETENSTLGGAANVAAHITNTDIECLFTFKAPIYKIDTSYTMLLEMLDEKNILPLPLLCEGKSSIPTKKRILAGHHQICRIDYEDPSPPDKKTQFEWYKQIIEIINKERISVVILSDYNKGTLTDDLIQMLANHCSMNNVKIILDPKRPSFVKLRRLDVIKPNGKEIPATNMTAEEVSIELGQTILVNTIGKDGVKAWQDGEELFSFPTFASDVRDVTGAGDSTAAIMGIAMHKGYNIKQSVYAGNLAASFAIKHYGTYVLTSDEIKECLDKALENG